jgi:peptide/nickel transport system ATP-binding protein
LDSAEEHFVQVRQLAISYSSQGSNAICALDGINLEIHAGEIIGVLGESGCGKSTLASALLRLLAPNTRCEGGTILFRGRDLLSLSESELRVIRGQEISLIPQDPALALNPVMTVGSQVAEVLRTHLPLRAEQRRARVKELLREVGFDYPDEIYSAYPHQLSGGQRQRIAIAQAVACRPALLIADEPTSKLDSILRAEIVTLMSQMRRQHSTAILVFSHDPALFPGLADRIAVMYAGRIVEVGSSADILGRPLHPYTQALVRLSMSTVMTEPGGKARLPAIEGESLDPTCMPVGCRFAPRCSERMDVCSRRFPQECLPETSRSVNCFKYGE